MKPCVTVLNRQSKGTNYSIMLNLINFNFYFRQKYDKTCINISDFDGVVYNLSNPNDDTTKLRLSIFLHFYKDLRQHGSDQVYLGSLDFLFF